METHRLASCPPPPGAHPCRCSPAPFPQDRRSPFTSAYQLGLPHGRRALLATTPAHLYCWVSPPGEASSAAAPLEALFAARPGATPQQHMQLMVQPALEAVAMAAPAASGQHGHAHSQLQLYWPAGGVAELPSRFAWLVGGVVYHGSLDWDALEQQQQPGQQAPAAGSTGGSGGGVITGVGSLPLAGAGLGGGWAAGLAAGCGSSGVWEGAMLW